MLNPIAALLVTYQRALLPPPMLPARGVSWPQSGIPWLFFGLAAITSFLVLVIGFALFDKHQWEIAERL